MKSEKGYIIMRLDHFGPTFIYKTLPVLRLNDTSHECKHRKELNIKCIFTYI